MTTTYLVEWLKSFTRKASKHHRGFESQNLVSLFLFDEETDFRFFLLMKTHVNAPNLFHSTPESKPRPSRHHIGTAKMRWKLVQQAHWANEIAVEEHEQLASDSDSSSDSLCPEGLRNFTVLNSNIW